MEESLLKILGIVDGINLGLAIAALIFVAIIWGKDLDNRVKNWRERNEKLLSLVI